MRRHRHSDHGSEETELNLTPMLDIVFIMLIFFVVTTSFVKESGLPFLLTARSGSTNVPSISVRSVPWLNVWWRKTRKGASSSRATVKRRSACW